MTAPAPVIRVISGDGSRDGAALVAAGIPAEPPREWFDYRDFPDGTPLTFTTDGQVYGRLANRRISHVGLPGQRRKAPFSATGYAYYHVGAVRCADGSLVNTGTVTMGGGHASTKLGVTADAARSWYDDVGTGIADVVAFDREDGVYCAGAARPGLTAAQMRTAMASPASGDWRPIDDEHNLVEPEMIAAHLVVTPGFATRRDVALAASADEEDEGQSLAFVASSGLMPRIVLASSSTDQAEEATMTSTETTTEAPGTEAVTAAAPPFGKGEPAPPSPSDGGSIAEGSVVTATGDLPPGEVQSVDGDEATVVFVVPLDALEDAGAGGKKAMAASARERLTQRELHGLRTAKEQADEQLAAIRASMDALTASVDGMKSKEDAREEDALLASIPGKTEAGA